MTPDDEPGQFDRYRAPEHHGQLLLVPDADELAGLIAANRQLIQQQQGPTIAAVSWPELVQRARQQLLVAAQEYSSYLGHQPAPLADHPQRILLTGHQPTLFHPGVWVKNFLLSELARQDDSIAIHLLIDNDVVGDTSIQVPAGDDSSPAVEAVAIDSPDPQIPFEEWSVADREMVETFAPRVLETGRHWLQQPLLAGVWQGLIDELDQVNNVAALLARARHRQEAALGLNTLEVSLGLVCQGEAFALFSSHLLEQLPLFQQAYNSSLADFRSSQGIRSASRPAPDLIDDGDWLEAPLWLWTEQQPQRRRGFVRRQDKSLLLSDRAGLELELPRADCATADELVSAFSAAEQRGIRIRPRALLTTMFARLLLGDLFIHGIGGARYDQVTDLIIARFLQLTPPGYAVVSATCQLPLPVPEVSDQELIELERQLRDLEFSPEVYLQQQLSSSVELDERDQIDSLVRQKRELLASQPDPAERREWHQQLQKLNQQLAGFTSAGRQQLQQELNLLQQQLRQRQLFRSREFSSCLFAGETLFPQLLEFVSPAP